MMNRWLRLLACTLSLTLAGCVGSPEEGEQPAPGNMVDPALDADACQHLIAGPSEEVDATEFLRIGTEDVTPGHLRWDIDLVGVSDDYSRGFIDFLVEEPGKVLIYKLSEPPSKLQTRTGTEILPEASDFVRGACAEIEVMERHTFDLDADTYKLWFGSLETGSATLVILMADDTDHSHGPAPGTSSAAIRAAMARRLRNPAREETHDETNVPAPGLAPGPRFPARDRRLHGQPR